MFLELFPAYAGVILSRLTINLARIAFPRLRGGDPDWLIEKVKEDTFSPPTRG